MTRFQLFGAAIAAGVSLWAVMDVQSFLYAFLITFFVCMIGIGVGTCIRSGAVECPPPTDDELDAMAFAEYLRALDRATGHGS
jgi:hypothetical protein